MRTSWREERGRGKWCKYIFIPKIKNLIKKVLIYITNLFVLKIQ